MSKNDKPTAKKNDPKSKKDAKQEEEPEEIDDGPHIFTTISEQVKKNLIPQNKIEKANLIDYTIGIIHPNIITKHKTCKEIIEKITNNNFTIFNFLQKQLTNQEIENLYFKHTKANYFNDIVTHMSTGPVAILVLINKEEFFFDENNIKTFYKSPIELERFDRRQRPSRREIRGRRGAARNLRDIYHQQRLLGERQRERRLSRAEHVLSPFALHSARVQLR